MKTLILMGLLTFNALAATDYVCNVRTLRLELKSQAEMSFLVIKDVQSQEFIYQGLVTEILTGNGESNLMFEVESGNYLQLRFKSAALNAGDTPLFGLVRGYTGRQFLDDSLKCFKK